MISYAMTREPRACYGCTACVQVCKAKAIRMVPNEEGFLYPVVDQDKCTQCGLCSKICPAENIPEQTEIEAVYAVVNKDEKALQHSSSGGVFRLLADYVLDMKGCVVGCVWDEHSKPILKIAEEKDELLPMQGSKYLSSEPGNVFSEVRRRLLNGQTVLFTGAPCQNAGLLNFLRQPFANLITVDFLCHGMPSQKAFDAYVAMLEKKYRIKIEQFQFRDKTARGWGLAESFVAGKRKKYFIGNTSPYLFGFVHGYFNRYSCYECPFRGKRITDFSICDYWGVSRHHVIFDTEKGVSAVSVNTQKAIELFQQLKGRCVTVDTKADWIAAENPSLLHGEVEDIPTLRKKIYTLIDREGWKQVERRHLKCRYRLLKRLWYKIPRKSAKVIKRILKRG